MGESRALHALVVDGSPEPSSPELVATLASGAEYVVAADRGGQNLWWPLWAVLM